MLAAACLAASGCLQAASNLQSIGLGGLASPPKPDAESDLSRARADGLTEGPLVVPELLSGLDSDDIVVRWKAQGRLEQLARADDLALEYDYRWDACERAAPLEVIQAQLGRHPGTLSEGHTP